MLFSVGKSILNNDQYKVVQWTLFKANLLGTNSYDCNRQVVGL